MKKVLIMFLVLSIVLMIFNIAAFADSESSAMTNKDYYVSQSDLIDKFCDGSITYEQYQEQSQSLTNAYVNSNTVGGVIQGGALNASNTVSALSQKVGATVDKYGDEARGYISDWWNGVCNKKGVPTETTQTSNMNMNGYGAVAVLETDRTIYNYYSTYIVINMSESYVIGNDIHYCYTRYGNIAEYQDWSKWDSSISTWYYSSYSSVSEWFDSRYKFYGDIRYADGTPYPTDDEYTYGTVKRYDEMTEKQLEDLIDDFSDKMTLENPDLSSLEGLLNAIYARMGTLDSDDDNELLSSINANILALIEADNNRNEADSSTNEDIVNTLIEIRDNLKNGTIGSDPNSHGHEISGTLYNVKPLDKNWLSQLVHGDENLKVEYESSIYYLQDCGCLKLGNNYYLVDMNYDSYTSIDYDFSNTDIDIDNSKYVDIDFDYRDINAIGLTSSQTKKVNSAVTLVQKLIAQSVPYSVVTGIMSDYEAIIFNIAEPKDIVLTVKDFELFGYNVSGFSVTILSAEFFNSSGVSSAMGIIKNFLKIVIGYSWLVTMRRKTVSMLE